MLSGTRVVELMDELDWVNGQLQAEIFAHQETRAALQKSEKRYCHLLENSPEFICTHDLQGLVLTMNPAAVRSLGYQLHECVGRNLREFLSPPAQRLFNAYLKRILRHHTAAGLVRIVTKTGEERVWSYRSVCLQEAGEPPYILGQAQDITERLRVEQALQSTQQWLWELARRLQQRQEAERRRIARDLHDDLGSVLTSLKIDVSWLARHMAAAPTPWQDRLTMITAQLEGLVDTVRRIGLAIRPSILDDLGLTAAIEYQLQDMQRRTGIAYTLTLPTEEVGLEPARVTALFRIFQEALTNVIRHAEASTVTVRVTMQPDALCLEVIDNGKSITPERLTHRNSLGILNMRERAQLWGGTVTIQGQPGAGTTVTVYMPYGPVRG